MKRNMLIAAAAVLAVSLSSCGSVEYNIVNSDISEESLDETETQTTAGAEDAAEDNAEENTQTEEITSEEEMEYTTAESDEESGETESDEEGSDEEYIAASGVCFIESVDGVDKYYISCLSADNQIMAEIGTTVTYPISFKATSDGSRLIINVGGVSDSLDPVDVTVSEDNTCVYFEQDGHEYSLRPIDYIPIQGTYNMVDDDGNILETWEFAADGTGNYIDSETGETVNFEFAQSKDTGVPTVDITAEGETATYVCLYDVVSINLITTDTDDEELLVFRAANS